MGLFTYSFITFVNVIILAKLGIHTYIVLETNMTMTKTQEEISAVCNDIKELLLYKNKQYGDSALNPSRIFSKASAVEQILVRIDDKLNRIQKGAGLVGEDEDVIQDLIGYLVLLKIGLKHQRDETNGLRSN